MGMKNINLISNPTWTLIIVLRDRTHSVSDGAATGRKSVQNDASLSNCQPPKFNSFNLTIQKSISCRQKSNSSRFMFLKKNSHGLYILIQTKRNLVLSGQKLSNNRLMRFSHL